MVGDHQNATSCPLYTVVMGGSRVKKKFKRWINGDKVLKRHLIHRLKEDYRGRVRLKVVAETLRVGYPVHSQHRGGQS